MKAPDTAVLGSQEHRDLLDTVDKLRSGGVGHHIDLPQIVVCGDQSSGKSSVLEAISGMSFPTKDNLCTRFATEVILRRAPASSVKFSITRADGQPETENDELQSFANAAAGPPEALDLARVMDKARQLLGVGERVAFSSGVLRVELSGPEQPHLTMVDLPGLFRAGNKEQSAEDAELVRDLVLSYMKRERTIILAVVSAKSDFALQEVTQLARQLDPKGTRTLGLITKPDTLDAGSDSEIAYVKLAQNNDVHFRLGWHVLRNRDYASRSSTLEERNKAEARFFSQGVWATLNPTHLGVTSLKQRLAAVLHDQVVSQLPRVVADLQNKAEECRAQLKKIGPSRSTLQEQHRYLIQASHQFYKLMRDACDGNYMDPFFSATDRSYKRRLRAVVQNCLLDLAFEMRQNGRAREIVDTDPAGPHEVSRDVFLDEVGDLLAKSRGRELPGMCNPIIIGQLFRDQSRPWRGILERSAGSILGNARDVVRLVLEHVLDDDVAESVSRWVVNAGLADIEQSLRAKLDEIMRPHETLHPITYSESLAELVQKRRLEKQEAEIRKIVKDSRDLEGLTETVLTRSLIAKAKRDLSREASSDAVDWMEAYYGIALSRTVDDFSSLAVECCLVQKLPGLFSPEAVYLLDDETVRRIGSENEATSAERARLTDMLSVLETGLMELRQRTGYQPAAHGKQSTSHNTPGSGITTNGETYTAPSENSRKVGSLVSSPPAPPAATEKPQIVETESAPAADDFPLDPKPSEKEQLRVKKKKKKESILDEPLRQADEPYAEKPEPEAVPAEDLWGTSCVKKKKKKKSIEGTYLG